MLGAFGIITAAFGEAATWVQTGTAYSGARLLGAGLFKEPTAGRVITPHVRNAAGAEYEQAHPTFEYASGQFFGLKEAAAISGAEEYLVIRQRMFLVGSVTRIFDGETYLAVLQEVLPTPAIPADILT